MTLLRIGKELGAALNRLRFGPPVARVYNPLVYAWQPFARYHELYGGGTREVLLLGMNPGPWGMAQTGIPFGEVNIARDWLGVAAPVGRPPREHPRRPILGFNCPRSEVSGVRLWSWARDTFGTPRRFFKRFFVSNYCPLCFMETSGRNLTPDRLPAASRERLLAACDRALRKTVDFLRPRFVVGVGGFAERRARAVLAGTDVVVGRILHPSPASPAANKDWAAQAADQLITLGITLPKIEINRRSVPRRARGRFGDRRP